LRRLTDLNTAPLRGFFIAYMFRLPFIVLAHFLRSAGLRVKRFGMRKEGISHRDAGYAEEYLFFIG
jgi:hypothetical protein